MNPSPMHNADAAHQSWWSARKLISAKKGCLVASLAVMRRRGSYRSILLSKSWPKGSRLGTICSPHCASLKAGGMQGIAFTGRLHACQLGPLRVHVRMQGHMQLHLLASCWSFQKAARQLTADHYCQQHCTWGISCGAHFGNSTLKSSRSRTPGQTASLGVPSTLNIFSSWSISCTPGGMGRGQQLQLSYASSLTDDCPALCCPH